LIQVRLGADPPGEDREALLVLVGVTANRRKRRGLLRHFSSRCNHDVFVPDLPYRKPLHEVAAWYVDYVTNVVRPERYARLHCIAYIAAGVMLRSLPPERRLGFERIVYFRGPYQELVAARLAQRIGRGLAGLVMGRTAVDLAEGWAERFPLRREAAHEALIVEEGRSDMARWLGIGASDIPPASWSDEALLPTAEAVLHIPESHDDVYTSESVLNATLEFILHGNFRNAEVTHAHAD
jgi:hypothetical protein